MIAFLLIFFSVYSCMNGVFFLRVRTILPPGGPAQILLGAFLILMIVAPIGTRILERGGFETAARVTAIMGYSWLGFVFLSFCLFVAAGFIDVLLNLAAFLSKTALPTLAGKTATSVMLLIVIGLCVYGYIDARNIRTERLVVKTDKLPANLNRLRIVQISDLHIGLIVRGERLRNVVEIVKRAEPDILVSTGDLIDGDIGDVEECARLFQLIGTRYGKYAITGNHEYYAGLQYSLDATERFGFKMLRGASDRAGDTISIAGVSDPVGGEAIDEATLLRSVAKDTFVLFLKHRPTVSDSYLGMFDLQLSGHSHRGQIFPFGLITGRVFPLQNGFNMLAKGSAIYTSRGTGTWGPPMRVLSPPEICVIDLIRK